MSNSPGPSAAGAPEFPSGLIDSHAHLQHLEESEREAALDEARAAGVLGFLVPATHLDEAEEVLRLAHRHPDVWCALGVHPHEAGRWTRESPARLRELLVDPRVIALGECGLDFHYDFAPREVQLRALQEQWEIALELDLPVVVHNRESDDEMLRALRRPEFARLRGDFHSFAGSEAMHAELLGRGFYFGFSGMVTFQKADNVRRLLAATPHDRVLVETDTPFLAPAPNRGKPNRPAWVTLVAARVGEEWGSPPSEVARRTGENFHRLFAGRSGTTAG